MWLGDRETTTVAVIVTVAVAAILPGDITDSSLIMLVVTKGLDVLLGNFVTNLLVQC